MVSVFVNWIYVNKKGFFAESREHVNKTSSSISGGKFINWGTISFLRWIVTGKISFRQVQPASYTQTKISY
jgi:hypothetical protein